MVARWFSVVGSASMQFSNCHTPKVVGSSKRAPKKYNVAIAHNWIRPHVPRNRRVCFSFCSSIRLFYLGHTKQQSSLRGAEQAWLEAVEYYRREEIVQ